MKITAKIKLKEIPTEKLVAELSRSTNDGAELLRWVSVAMEFTEALLAESVDSGSLTQNERGAILAAKASSKNHYDNLQYLLKSRTEREWR